MKEDIIDVIYKSENNKNIINMFNKFLFDVYKYDLTFSTNDFLNKINKENGSGRDKFKDTFPTFNLIHSYLFQKMFFSKYNETVSNHNRNKPRIEKLIQEKNKYFNFNESTANIEDEIETLKEESIIFPISYFIENYKNEFLKLQENKSYFIENYDFFMQQYFGNKKNCDKYMKAIFDMCKQLDIAKIDKKTIKIKDALTKYDNIIDAYSKMQIVLKKLDECNQVLESGYSKFLIKNMSAVKKAFYSRISDKKISLFYLLIEQNLLSTLNIHLVPYCRFFDGSENRDGKTFKDLFKSQNSITSLNILNENIEKNMNKIDDKLYNEMLNIKKLADLT